MLHGTYGTHTWTESSHYSMSNHFTFITLKYWEKKDGLRIWNEYAVLIKVEPVKTPYLVYTSDTYRSYSQVQIRRK